MSIQQRTSTALSTRMVTNSYDSLDRISSRYETLAGNAHASIVLRDGFWADLQNRMTAYIAERRALLAAGGYVAEARELGVVEDFAIRTAVEKFRARALDDPYIIHDEEAWGDFRDDIRSFADSWNE